MYGKQVVHLIQSCMASYYNYCITCVILILRKSEFALYSFISGHCPEYSSSGNLIQPNLNTNCMDFSSKPCPIAYKSTEAYKCMLDCFLYNAPKCILPGHLEIDKSVFLPHLLSICLSLT